MSWTLFPTETVRPSRTTRYKIEYIPCTAEFVRGPSGKFDQQPTQRTSVRGYEAYRATCRAIRQAGGQVVRVRTGWLS